jgi:hypothetical protein
MGLHLDDRGRAWLAGQGRRLHFDPRIDIMRRWIGRLAFIPLAWAAVGGAASAQDVGASSNGNWNDPTIWTSGTVPGSSNNVFIGSTTPAGSASVATVTLTQNQSAGNLTLGDGSGTSGTLKLGSNTLTIGDTLTIGLNGGLGTITEGSGGSFTAATVNVESGNTFAFGSGDVTTNLNLYSGATGTTAATCNVTGSIMDYSGSTLNLGANLSLSGSLDVENTGSVLNMNGQSLNAGTILLAWFVGPAVTVQNQGTVQATDFYLGNGMAYNFLATDVVSNLHLNGATATTATTGNVTASATVDGGGTLNLGANLNVSGSLDILNGGTVNAHGFGITSNQLTVGYFGSSAASLINTGLVQANFFFMGNGSTLTLHGGDVVNDSITLQGGSVLNVQQTGGTGLTLNGAFDGALTIDPSDMHLIFNVNTSPNWDFRWADPAGGNWIATLDAMIASGQIVVTAPDGYTIIDQGGYTYIEGGIASVPEPSSLVLAGLAGAGVAAGAWWRRRRPGR